MALFVQATADGLQMGLLYALVAVGLAIIWGLMEMINFAHGEFMMLGMFGAWGLSVTLGWDPLVSMVPIAILMYLLGVLVYRLLMQRVQRGEIFTQIFATVGLFFFIQNGVVALFTSDYRFIERSFLNECAKRVRYPKTFLNGAGTAGVGAMQLDDELLAFLQRPLMCIIAAADDGGRPAAGRGVGVQVLEDRETIDVIFSAWQWPRLESSIRQTGRIAVTFVSPSDYVTFQIKGPAVIRVAEATDLDCAGRFMTNATDALASLGVSPSIIAPWLTARDARVARVEAREIYVQTPGPHAGMLAGARS